MRWLFACRWFREFYSILFTCLPVSPCGDYLPRIAWDAVIICLPDMDRMSVLVLPGRCWQSVYFSCRDKWDEKDETTFSSYCGFILVGTSINRSQDLVLLPDMDHSLYIGPWRVVVKVTIYCAAFVLFETRLSNKRCPLLPCMHICLEFLLKSIS